MKIYIRASVIDISKEPKEVRVEIARTSNNESVLTQLSKDSDATVRWWVATNNSTPLDVLTDLTDDVLVSTCAIALNNIFNNDKAPVLSLMSNLPLERIFEVATCANTLPQVKEYAADIIKHSGNTDMIEELEYMGLL